MSASRTFTEAFQKYPDDEEARQEYLSGSDSYDGDGTENDNSNSDLDLIEGDGIGGDNDIATNEAAAEEFSEEVATGEIDGHAPDSEVNAVYGTDGDPVAVAASEEEIEQSDATMYTTQENQQPTVPQTPDEARQEMRASYQALINQLRGQQADTNASPVLAVGGIGVVAIAAYWVMTG